MQRDFDLVVTILGELRDADTAALSQEDIEAAVQASMPDAPPAPLIAHHLDILSDAGLITLVPATDDSDAETYWRLTWKGHDALEQEEDDEDEDEDDYDDEDDDEN
ncbi:DUF2513 domain-containing protein [Bordetella genomosp. 4]|uniref:DUF2513 domain-containing protein n=1 Tax=Bordetella genomosp. 4 TaxID=463044 RepID=A0A261U571_9BORD|nr:DUF2513 domain-containing protein [Bordetella genomosp. 4]OZI48721.1 DUF2513 domain-containing protein [Bordetella genomosp. 4]OZI56721.1 DUF2513 domain-containing protein [Bordetella genomosp. 4]